MRIKTWAYLHMDSRESIQAFIMLTWVFTEIHYVNIMMQVKMFFWTLLETWHLLDQLKIDCKMQANMIIYNTQTDYKDKRDRNTEYAWTC